MSVAAAAAAGVQVERRTSGGAAVLADGSMLALDVALPASDSRAGADVLEAYRWLGEAIQEALSPLTAPGSPELRLAALDEAREDQRAQRGAPPGSPESLRGLACFGTLSPYEVVLDGTAEALSSNEDVKEFYLGGHGAERKSFRNLKSYKRRKRWL